MNLVLYPCELCMWNQKQAVQAADRMLSKQHWLSGLSLPLQGVFAVDTLAMQQPKVLSLTLCLMSMPRMLCPGSLAAKARGNLPGPAQLRSLQRLHLHIACSKV